MLRAAVSGSFHRHMPAIYAAVNELRALGVEVLSPSDPRVVDYIGEFLFVASDKLRSVRLIQDRHFEAIRSSNFLWLVCPDGYVGPSASAEIGAAHMAGTPIFSTTLPFDLTLRQYVHLVPSISAGIEQIRENTKGRAPAAPHILVDPERAIDVSIASLESVRKLLLGKQLKDPEKLETDIKKQLQVLAATIGYDPSQAL